MTGVHAKSRSLPAPLGEPAKWPPQFEPTNNFNLTKLKVARELPVRLHARSA